MSSSDQPAVLAATRKLIQQARQFVPTYAAGFCPTSTADVSALLVSSNTMLVERRFTSDAKGMAQPFLGGHLIAIDTGCSRADAMFTLRHELAHIFAGEASEPTYLTSEDTMSFSERCADLFAVADLSPTRWLGWACRGWGGGARPWRAVELEVLQAYRELTEDWSEQRLWDRARLRVALYRDHGI